jgi:hypothetical protein
MFIFTVVITIVASYFAKQEYDRNHIGLAMFWSALLGWDLHTLISML